MSEGQADPTDERTGRAPTAAGGVPITRLWPQPYGPLGPAELAAAYGLPPPHAGRPSVTVNFVSSVDGAVTVGGRTAGLAGPADQEVFRLLRRGCDALLVGAGTLRNERYSPLRRGVLVVVSGRLDLDAGAPALAAAPVRPVVLTHAGAPAERRAALEAVADVLVCGPDEVDLAAGLAHLRGRGIGRVLCEGGPVLLGALTAADLVDDLCLTVAPLLAGPGAGRITAGAPTPLRKLSLRQILTGGDELLLRYARPGPAGRSAG